MQAILDVFEKENPTIHIDLQEIPGPDYTVKRNTAMTAGEGPDLIAFSPGSELRAAAEADCFEGFVLANNKAEGSAPLTVGEIAIRVARELR